MVSDMTLKTTGKAPTKSAPAGRGGRGVPGGREATGSSEAAGAANAAAVAKTGATAEVSVPGGRVASGSISGNAGCEAGGVSGIMARLESARAEAAREAARKAATGSGVSAEGDGGVAVEVDSVDAIAAQLALDSDDVEMIRIRGARQHNLKNIDLEIPHNAITVITGVSGSGKSSLAFDTIYAEGQRRYIESLSAYARQFLE